MLSYSLERRFTCVVRRVPRRIGDALFGPSYDNARGSLRFEDRQQRGDAIDDAEKVDIERRPEWFRILPVGRVLSAGIKEKEINAP